MPIAVQARPGAARAKTIISETKFLNPDSKMAI